MSRCASPMLKQPVAVGRLGHVGGERFRSILRIMSKFRMCVVEHPNGQVWIVRKLRFRGRWGRLHVAYGERAVASTLRGTVGAARSKPYPLFLGMRLLMH